MAPEGYENILNYAYKGAISTIERWGGSDRWRSANKNLTIKGIKQKMADIEYFLSRPTSTISQIKKIYKKRADSLNKTLNEGLEPGEPRVNFTWEDMAKFFESGGMEKIKGKEFDSKTLFKRMYQKKYERRALSEFEKKKLEEEIKNGTRDTVYWNTVDAINKFMKENHLRQKDFYL